MTLLTIAQDAADYIGFTRPGSIIGATSDTARRLLSMCNREGEFLSQDEPPWNELVIEGSITLVTADQDYALPTDYRHMIPDTTWNRESSRRVITPISPSQWQFYKAWDTVDGINFRARIRNSQLEFEQTITAADNGTVITFEYISKYWAISDGTGSADQTRFANDADTVVFDEELFTQGVIWRLEKSTGLDWKDSFTMYEKLKRKKLARSNSARTLDRTGNSFGRYLGVNVPDDDYIL